MGCQARNGGNNDGAGNPRNIPCNHAGLAWSTFPRPSPSPQSIALSLAQELDVLSQDGYSAAGDGAGDGAGAKTLMLRNEIM